MFKKILVANRGEIALRVIRTCRRLGIRTVAVYSDADRRAPHVFAVDEAVRLGRAEPAESYLSIPRLLDAARATGAEALHPGYGFLSERAELAEACAAAGIMFVGPPAAAMRALGDKIGARRLARRCRVPVVPGYDGGDQHDATLDREARRLGFPLLVKAAAGGGGRGMRRIDAPGALPAALAAARREAAGAFGDAGLILEQVVEPARHVEVQLLADACGHVAAIGDRDCSLQRRYQKVIEEAPAPDLPPALRRRLHRAAERLARWAGYVGAGTAEFLVHHGRAYFLELNARLQVEHTVTEQVTGLDLVEWQLRIAAGERLSFDTVPGARGRRVAGGEGAVVGGLPSTVGHAIQARVYAEDPARGFVPASGVATLVRWPVGAGVRVDATLTAAGQAVPAEYDALLGKVICTAPERREALRRLDAALAGTAVLGLPTNVAFLRRLATTPEVVAGPVDTGFLERHPELAADGPPPTGVLAAVAAAALRGPHAWRLAAGWEAGGGRRAVRLRWEHEGYAVDPAAPADGLAGGVDLIPIVAPDGRRGWEAGHGGARWQIWLDVPAAPPVDPGALREAGAAAPASRPLGPMAGRRPRPETLAAGGAPDWGAGAPPAAGHSLLEAPLAGKVAEVLVTEGQEVLPGAAVAALEAMKMQHVVAAPRRARVVRLLVAAGAFVRAGQPLAELAPPADSEPVESR